MELSGSDRIELERYIGEISGNVKVNTALLHEIKAEMTKREIEFRALKKRIGKVEIGVAKILALGGAAGTVASAVFSVVMRYFVG